MENRTRFWVNEKDESFIITQPQIVELPLISVDGRFRCEVINSTTNEIVEVREFKNTILNRWLDGYANTALSIPLSNGLQWIVAGTGSVTGSHVISPSDTTLSGEISPRTAFQGGISPVNGFISSSVDGPYWYYQKTMQFLETEANGLLTEIGFSDSSTFNDPLTVRTAIKDDSGSLAPILKTTDNQLRIIYELRLYPPTGSSTASFSLDGTSYTCEIIPQNISDSSGWGPTQGMLAWWSLTYSPKISAWESIILNDEYHSYIIPSGSSSTFLSSTKFGIWQSGSLYTGSDGYVSGQFYYDQYISLEPSVANFANGVQGMTLRYSYDQIARTPSEIWKMKFTPSIPKTDLQRFFIVFRHTWGRKT